MYILVHLEVSVGGEVVGVTEPLQGRVDAGVAGGCAGHEQRGGCGGAVLADRVAGPGGLAFGGGASSRTSVPVTESLMPRRYREALG